MSNADDNFLIKRFNDGDEKVFSEIVGRHKKAVYSLCFRYLGNHQDADEISQETFIRAFRSLSGFRFQSSFRTWLFRIAINLSINEFNRTKKFTELSPENDSISHNPSDDDLKRNIREEVMKLPEKQRETVILKAYEGMKYHEIAEVMQCSVGTAKANFHHGINSIREKLGIGKTNDE